jgi:hypothetical protein
VGSGDGGKWAGRRVVAEGGQDRQLVAQDLLVQQPDDLLDERLPVAAGGVDAELGDQGLQGFVRHALGPGEQLHQGGGGVQPAPGPVVLAPAGAEEGGEVVELVPGQLLVGGDTRPAEDRRVQRALVGAEIMWKRIEAFSLSGSGRTGPNRTSVASRACSTSDGSRSAASRR